MAGLALAGIEKRFGGLDILKGVDLEIREGEFIALVGPSGCGKTTLLRIAAGLEFPDRGQVMLDGRDVTDLRAADRDIAMVFQSYALYPHLTAAQNMAVPLAMRRLTRPERLPLIGGWLPGARAKRQAILRDVEAAARMLRIEGLLDRKPGQMSGGQRQRVALGRALVRKPSAFLMDEPLSNLDAALRVHTRTEIVELHRAVGVATLYVTHDQAEALSMADRVAVMIGGILLQLAPPETIYRDPRHVAVAEFIGSPKVNLLTATIDAVGRALVDGVPMAAGIPAAAGTSVVLGIRPEALRLRREAGGGSLPARVRRLEYLGAETLIHLTGPQGALIAQVATAPSAASRLVASDLRPGGQVWIGANLDQTLVFANDGVRIDVDRPPALMTVNG